MSETVATLAQKLEKGYVKLVRFDTDKILYVSGKPAKIGNALNSPCETPEELKASANGAKTQFLPLKDITRFQTRSDRKGIEIGFKSPKGWASTIEIDASDLASKELIVQQMGEQLNQIGFQRNEKKASFFAVSWLPVLVMLGTLFLGGLLTAAQASGEGIHVDEEYGGGRSARKARGLRIMIATVSNLLGFWGCLAVTAVIFLGALLYLFRNLGNRPLVTTWKPQA